MANETTAVAVPSTFTELASGLQSLGMTLRRAEDNHARIILIDKAHVLDGMCAAILADFEQREFEADDAEALALLDAVKELRTKVALFECDAERDIVKTPKGERGKGAPQADAHRTRVSRLRTAYEALSEAGGTTLDQVADAVRFRVETERSTSPRVRRAMLREGAADEDQMVVVNDVDFAPATVEEIEEIAPTEKAKPKPAGGGKAKTKAEAKAKVKATQPSTFGDARAVLARFVREATPERLDAWRAAADAFVANTEDVPADLEIDDPEVVDIIGTANEINDAFETFEGIETLLASFVLMASDGPAVWDADEDEAYEADDDA